MTPFNEIIVELKTATHPVATAIHKGDNFKILGIGFNKGMILKDHQAHIKSKLTVLSGAVLYKEGVIEHLLKQYDEVEIPIGVIHSVEGMDFSICLLTQG